MSDQWCYTRDGRTTSVPVAWEILKHFALTGELLPSDLLGRIGMATPVRAGSVAGLFGLAANASKVIPCLVGPTPLMADS